LDVFKSAGKSAGAQAPRSEFKIQGELCASAHAVTIRLQKTFGASDMIWTISGAGRAVGKTTVAQSIAASLDSSVYCKCGHNAAKSDKPDNFFLGIDALNDFVDNASDQYAHIVVESNAFVYSSRPDITIFIDGIKGKTNFRKDASRLKAAADIAITADSSPAQWKQCLSSRLPDTKTVEAICRCLSSQHRWLYCGENQYA
jgi:hypothetical protein